MFRIVFRYEHTEHATVITATPEETVLHAAQRAGIAIDAPCGGNGVCGKCRIKLLEGSVRELPTSHLTDQEREDGWVLSCCCKATSDLIVLVPNAATAYQSGIKTADLSDPKETAIFAALLEEAQEAGISMDNDFVTVELTMQPPATEDTMPDNERLALALRQSVGCEEIKLSRYALSRLPKVFRGNHFCIQVIGVNRESCFQVYEFASFGDSSPLCGLAIDIGTTTVCGVLFDLKNGTLLAKGSCGNGQIPYGADVIHRIVAQGEPRGVERLRDAIVKDTLQPLIEALCRSAKLPAHRILRVGITANTTMNHLLLGLDADPIRTEPYVPAFFRCEPMEAWELGLPVHPKASCLIAPNLGSYVGGDITAGVLAEGLWHRESLSLFLDLGTNGEIVLGNEEFQIACACSAGPAFEGGDISCGMRAADGAVEAVTICRETMEPTLRIIGGGKAMGLCGSGLIDLIAELFRCGIINAKGMLCGEGSRVVRDGDGCGRYVLVLPGESADGREIALTEVDIDNFIRAKGAVYSAIDTLLSAMDLDAAALERISIAGGIGSGINIENAIRIGMLPKVPISHFRYVGNTSLAGAYLITRSVSAAQRLDSLSKGMTYMELSTEAGYMDRFVAACFLPHTDAARFPDE